MSSRLAAYYRLLELVERMRRGGPGLTCPACGVVSREHQLVDEQESPRLQCSSCSAHFDVTTPESAPAFEKDGDLIVLYRPAGSEELALVEASGWTRWPPRLPEQPIFYPVLNQRYAEYIAREWNAGEGDRGFVTRFAVRAAAVASYEVQVVGAAWHQELWIPAEELDEFNAGIAGVIEVVRVFEPVI